MAGCRVATGTAPTNVVPREAVESYIASWRGWHGLPPLFPTPPLQLLLVTIGTPFRRYPMGYGFRRCRAARTGNSGPNLQMNHIGATLTNASGIPIDSSTNNFMKEIAP